MITIRLSRAPLPVSLLLMLLIAAWAPGAARAADPVAEWQEIYDGGSGLADQGAAALCDAAGNVIVAGESNDGNGADLMVRKLARATGDTLWTVRVAAVDDNDMQVGGMVWDHFGNVLIGGTRLGCFG
jgi:hypothetical protein